jgi:hypothetical protein
VKNSSIAGLSRLLVIAFAFTLPASSIPQFPEPPDQPAPEIKLPNGKSQREAILKEEHEKTLRDVARIQKLAGELKTDLEKSDFHILSVSSLKKTEEIEKLARQVRNRMRR